MADDQKPVTPQEKIISTNAYSHSAKRWLYLGVGTLLVAMIGLWGYSMFASLAFFDWGNSREAKLFKNTKQEFDALVKDNPVLNEKIKERWQAIKQEAASSTIVSSTAVSSTK